MGLAHVNRVNVRTAQLKQLKRKIFMLPMLNRDKKSALVIG